MFFEEVLLFEDELHDHGVSSLSVKVVSIRRCIKDTWGLNWLINAKHSSFWDLNFKAQSSSSLLLEI